MISENLERQKIEEREFFTYEEKMEIAQKSSMRCSHCGKIVYPDFGGTIDHYLPLSKGGSNRNINLIWMCQECNKEKNNRIVDPWRYLPYLKQEEREKLDGYFQSYLQSFDYIEKTNILACDLYMIELVFTKNQPKGTLYQIKKAIFRKKGINDRDKILEYYIRYLKKYDCLAGEDVAARDIDDVYKNGCIYYVENKNHEISVLTFVQYLQSETSEFPRLVIDIFSYYSTANAKTLVKSLMMDIPSFILEEQRLPYLRVAYGFLNNDSMAHHMLQNKQTVSLNDLPMCYAPMRVRNKGYTENEQNKTKDEQKIIDFFNRIR